jgi:hypothetical protein
LTPPCCILCIRIGVKGWWVVDLSGVPSMNLPPRDEEFSV